MDRTGGSGAGARGATGDTDLARLLIDRTSEYALFALDGDGSVVSWNDGAERVTGYAADEIIGHHISRLHPEAMRARHLPEQLLAIATADGHVEDEGWRVRKDDTPFWATVATTALRGDDGRLLGFGIVLRDLTERKRGEDLLRESEERFRLLVSSVTDYAIFLLAPDGTIASWNLGAERLKGYRTDEIIGSHFSRFYTEEDLRAGVPEGGLREALEQGRWESEGWRVRRDGTRFWADVVITALHGSDGQHRGFAKVTRDLTERKRSEDALRGVLERERETSARLRELDEMKNELVTVIAHDLRGPVEVVRGLLHLLQDQWDTTPEPGRRDLVQRAMTRVESMGTFVDEVLDLARIEAGDLGVVTEPMDLGAIVDQVVADTAVSAPDRVLQVEMSPGTKAIGDPRRAWQVLANLVSNAVKFSPADAPIRIAVTREDNEIVLTVEDRGPGIPDEQQLLLFQRFVRLPHTAGTAPGSGVGLFIARSLVEAQGGRMWVRSEVGTGSAFSFSLPATDDPLG